LPASSSSQRAGRQHQGAEREARRQQAAGDVAFQNGAHPMHSALERRVGVVLRLGLNQRAADRGD
jgi:hypothetical protein